MTTTITTTFGRLLIFAVLLVLFPLTSRRSNVQVALVDETKKGAGSVVIEGARGAFRFSTGTQNKGDVKIKTSSGTLGIRG